MTKPRQKTLRDLVVHVSKKPYDVYIGRPTMWGNPFSHLTTETLAEYHVGSRDEAVDAYAEWIQTQPELLAALPKLKGRILGCWCAPERCHGDVLARLANRDDDAERSAQQARLT